GHANQARIRTFPLQKANDWDNPKATVFHAADVVSFAREMKYFNGKDADFSFADAYCPLNFGAQRGCEARVWSMFRRAAPSLNLPADYARGVKGAKPLPLWVKPDQKLGVRECMELMRDHFEGTEFDMTKDVGAGEFRLPYRWRPMEWEVDGKKYVNERAISTQQTGFSFIAQSRGWLPGPIGGVFWFGVDDTYTTVWVPMYCGIKAPPKPYAAGTGDFSRFNWDSAFWVFNFVANYAYGRYSDMIVDIQKVQRELEGRFMADQSEVEQAALAQYKIAPELAREYLTAYSSRLAEETVARWRRLGEHLIWKYLDGNLHDEMGNVQHPDHPEHWLRQIVKDHGDVVKVLEEPKKP
ncbi:MAG TPA: C69 family dipeptidase, partial [Candidatus Aminicenantes bacterium]|nr:C69 family dipeptidase [Candidatus Aminicenantes bacterium]